MDNTIEAFKSHAAALAVPATPSDAELSRREAQLTAKIKFIFSAPHETEADQNEQRLAIAALQSERAGVQAKLKKMTEAKCDKPAKMPSDKELRARLERIGNLLEHAATGKDPRAVQAAHVVLKLITGGKILLTQQGERKRHNGWLRASFVIDILKVAGPDGSSSDTPRAMDVDIKRPEIQIGMDLSRKLKALYDEGMLVKQISRQFGLNRNTAHDLLKAAFAEVGQTMVDGRTRRSMLEKMHLTPPAYQARSDEAKALADQGLLLQDIAKKMGMCRDVVTRTLRYWYTSRNLPYLDGRHRRKELSRDQPD
jgi:transposase